MKLLSGCIHNHCFCYSYRLSFFSHYIRNFSSSDCSLVNDWKTCITNRRHFRLFARDWVLRIVFILHVCLPCFHISQWLDLLRICHCSFFWRSFLQNISWSNWIRLARILWFKLWRHSYKICGNLLLSFCFSWL